ncbi:winged helix-turn-helix domain-containing protein [Klebsiella huaxiensis]|uniref:winged helix-turn-helix domain-containing protein n=1 Tax=Klebsiella huaxiensis TaxID=2153354 RepID=UPI002F2E249B
MDKDIFGYRLNQDVYVDIENKTLVNISKIPSVHHRYSVTLRSTMFRLLIFLLEHADDGIIKNSDILNNVWDDYGLSSSNQRLWQVMYALKDKLRRIGLPEDFIMRIESKGYYIRKDMITTLYTQRTNMDNKDVNNDIYSL